MNPNSNGNGHAAAPPPPSSESLLPSEVRTVKTTDLVNLRETLVQVWRSVESLRATVAQQQTELNQLKTAIEDRQEGWATALNKTNETTLAALSLVQAQQDKQSELMQLCQERFAEVDRGLAHADAYAQACQVAINFLSHHLMEVLAPEVLPHLQEFEDKMMAKLKRFDRDPNEDQCGKG